MQPPSSQAAAQYVCVSYMHMLYINSMRVLLTEGAGLTSRQVATQLDGMGHDVSVAASDRLCLARFTRHVRALCPVPPFGRQPLVWFNHLLEVARAGHFDVVFPTQEQVSVLSHQLPRLVGAGLATAVPPFSSLVQVHDKVSARSTLERLGIPQPRSMVLQDASELAHWAIFPAYVKSPLGTGSTGVRRAIDAPALARAFHHFMAAGASEDGGVLVQEALVGTFVMAQCVFDAGSLMAFHAVERVQEGAKGSASAKASRDTPLLRQNLASLGRALDWHGGLSVDAIEVDDITYVIDVNARLVEPANALAAGTDLVATFLAVARHEPVRPTPPSRAGVRTHQFLMALLGTAEHSGQRRQLLGEIGRCVFRSGVYSDSAEELLPGHRDWRTIVLPVVASLVTLIRPALWRLFSDGAVSRYALTPEGWHQLRRLAAPQPQSNVNLNPRCEASKPNAA
jgi:hypothetical protein